MERNIEWRVRGIYNADPAKVYNEIEEIGESCSAADIVERAKDRSTELHKCFTWDNTEAANKWRLHQARNIVCSLVIRVEQSEKKEEKPIPLRMIVNKDTDHYVPIKTITKVADDYEKILEQAKRDAIAFSRKYASSPSLKRYARQSMMLPLVLPITGRKE